MACRVAFGPWAVLCPSLTRWTSFAFLVFARLSSQEPRVKFADPEPEPSYVRKIMSSYSPSPKRDKLREYEPVQTGLHSSIVNSGEFDDPSMDESVASAGIRLDLQQRFGDDSKMINDDKNTRHIADILILSTFCDNILNKRFMLCQVLALFSEF